MPEKRRQHESDRYSRCGCLTASTLQHRSDPRDSMTARGVLDHSSGCGQHTKPAVTMVTVGKLCPPGAITIVSHSSSFSAANSQI